MWCLPPHTPIKLSGQSCRFGCWSHFWFRSSAIRLQQDVLIVGGLTGNVLRALRGGLFFTDVHEYPQTPSLIAKFRQWICLRHGFWNKQSAEPIVNELNADK